MAYQPAGSFNAKAIFVEVYWRYLNSRLGYMKIHTLPKGFSPKVKVWLEFEFAYFDVADRQFRHYVTGTFILKQGNHHKI